MPRPDKEINPGRLDGPISPARSSAWTKYGEAETADSRVESPNTIEIVVDDITVTQSSDELDSKYTTRGTSAHGIGLPEEMLKKPRVEYVREWVIDRTVEGRTYRRVDKLVMVELEG
jgi:hypothetical protein